MYYYPQQPYIIYTPQTTFTPQFWQSLAATIAIVIISSLADWAIEKVGKPLLHQGSRVYKEVTVPGGSAWVCSGCGKKLFTGEKVVKSGVIILCRECVQAGKAS